MGMGGFKSRDRADPPWGNRLLILPHSVHPALPSFLPFCPWVAKSPGFGVLSLDIEISGFCPRVSRFWIVVQKKPEIWRNQRSGETRDLGFGD